MPSVEIVPSKAKRFVFRHFQETFRVSSSMAAGTGTPFGTRRYVRTIVGRIASRQDGLRNEQGKWFPSAPGYKFSGLKE
jgi:hypothetical protein